jgi:hypothetical protein
VKTRDSFDREIRQVEKKLTNIAVEADPLKDEKKEDPKKGSS